MVQTRPSVLFRGLDAPEVVKKPISCRVITKCDNSQEAGHRIRENTGRNRARNHAAAAAAAAALCCWLTLFSGCAVKQRINQQMASWVGAPAAQLIAAVGPPSQVFQNPGGGYVLLWQRDTHIMVRPPTSYTTGSASWLGGNHIYTQARTTYDPGQIVSYSSYRMFITDAEGIITGWRWQGL